MAKSTGQRCSGGSFSQGSRPMPVIRISQQTWERLKNLATPLENTENDVVNMALDALEFALRKKQPVPRRSAIASTTRSPRSKQRKRLSLKQLREPLLETLYAQGGKAYSREIRAEVEHLVAPILGAADYELVSNGQPRWWNAVCSVRNDLIRDGIFVADSERGVWELSKHGFEFMRTRANQEPSKGQTVQRGGSKRTESGSRRNLSSKRR
jgi:hypothetical protein